MLAEKDFMYSLLYVFVSQYSNKVDFLSTSEAHMGGLKIGHSQTGSHGPLEAATAADH